MNIRLTILPVYGRARESIFNCLIRKLGLLQYFFSLSDASTSKSSRRGPPHSFRTSNDGARHGNTPPGMLHANSNRRASYITRVPDPGCSPRTTWLVPLTSQLPEKVNLFATVKQLIPERSRQLELTLLGMIHSSASVKLFTEAARGKVAKAAVEKSSFPVEPLAPASWIVNVAVEFAGGAVGKSKRMVKFTFAPLVAICA